jgi:hypothetical protein
MSIAESEDYNLLKEDRFDEYLERKAAKGMGKNFEGGFDTQ